MVTMPRSNADDPLRTTDHDPSSATPGSGVTRDFASGSPPADGGTAAYVPGGDTQPMGAAPEQAPVSVSGYEIDRVLGRGGMGVVYKALHLKLKRTVALKMVLAGGHAGPGELAGFRIEAEAVARLQHPNIVQIHEVGEADGHPYCALEFVEGGNLASKLNGKPMPDREAAKLVEVLARAMQLAHSRNVVHRDLKPANILLTADGTPKITDFGLARQMDSESGETQGGAVMGTPSYMAPEQASGHAHEAGPAADIYALGAILYDCLTSRPPFKGSTIVETLDQVRTQEPVPPSRWQADVPLYLDTICLKCLRKEPENRYASAAELADELVRYQQGEPILARPVGRVERAVKWVKRNPVVAASMAGLIGIFLAAFVLVSWSVWRAEASFKEEAKQRKDADDARVLAQQQQKAERWERYRANMVAATSALELHNVGDARGALDAAPEEHRGWEWKHLFQQLDRAEVVLGNANPTVDVCFSTQGEIAALRDNANTLYLWNVRTRKRIEPFGTNVGSAFMNISPDGATLGLLVDKLTLRDVKSGTNRHELLLPGASPQGNLAFSPDSTRVAMCFQDRTVHVWDTVTGNLLHILRGHETNPGSLAFSPDSRRLASCGVEDRTVRLWDLESGKTIQVLKDHEDRVSGVLFSPQGDRLLSVEYYPSNVLRLWDLATGKPLGVLRGHRNDVRAFAFSPDGTQIATGSYDQTIRLWDGQTGKPLATLAGHTGPILSVEFRQDGRRLLSASMDQTARLWDTTAGAALGVLHGHTRNVLLATFSSDGAKFVTGSADGTVRLWDANNIERSGGLRGHTKFVYGVAFHPDGERVASASWDGTVRIWQAATGKQLAVLPYPEKTIVTSVAFHPDGKLLASLGRDDCVRLWNVDTGQEVHRFPMKSNHFNDSRLTFSARGDLLAAGSAVRTIHIWDVHRRAEVAVLTGRGDTLREVVFSSDGAWLAAAGERFDKSIRIWDLAKKEQTHQLEGHSSTVYALALSRDGKRLASGSTDGTVRLWDTTTWKEVQTLQHGTNVYGVAFSPDGTRLACACANNTIRLWDTAKQQSVAVLHGHTDYVHAVAWSQDGTRLVSGSGDFTVRVWDSLPPAVRARPKDAYMPPKGYVAYRATQPIQLDGKLDDEAWKAAPWTDDFVDIEGDLRIKPRHQTRVKMLWDDKYLYLGAELEEPHVQGTFTKRDSYIFQEDNDFEVFINPDGNNHNYAELEMNALNTVWDLRLKKPYRDGGKAEDAWDIPGLKTAVHVNGTINNPRDTDKGWTIEIAIPWEVVKALNNKPAQPPRDGDQWRVNFSRVQWRYDVVDGKYVRRKDRREDNWVWSPQWVVDMHRPELWGYVQFSTAAPGKGTFRPDPAGLAKHVLHRVYHAQVAFHKVHKRYADSLKELGLPDLNHDSLVAPPVIDVSDGGYRATVSLRVSDGTSRRWRIRQDSLAEPVMEK